MIVLPKRPRKCRSFEVGFGIHCESHSSLEDPVVAQRLLHGTVYVVRELVGVTKLRWKP